MLCEGHCPKCIISMCGACLFYCEIDEYAHKNHNQGLHIKRDKLFASNGGKD